MIVRVEDSPLRTKRFRVYLKDNRHFDFGLKGGKTYLDHQDKVKRMNYRKRHLANPLEKKLIENGTPSPALYSYYLLWGEYTDLKKNIEDLNKSTIV